MIQLKSSRLKVSLAEPGEAPNTTTRFDTSGFIADVILDGSIYFCASEPNNLCHPSTGGRGLCSEIVFDVSEECPVGEYFPKLGVGLLCKREPGRYRIFHKFDDVKRFPVSIEADGNSAVFETGAISCMGYAVETSRKIQVRDNRLQMTCRMTNVGEKAVCASEYCHNFISIDGMAVGSDYILQMPGIPDLGHGRLKNMCGENGSLRGYGHGFTFAEMSAVASDYAIPGQELADGGEFSWKLTHAGAKASVEATDAFKPERFCLWAVDHMVCPETFYRISLEAGAAAEWTRSWEFNTTR